MLVRLKVSKTDPFRQGQTIVVGKTKSPMCPISAMVAYHYLLQAPVFRLWTPFHLCIWWALNPGETNKGNKAPNQHGGV